MSRLATTFQVADLGPDIRVGQLDATPTLPVEPFSSELRPLPFLAFLPRLLVFPHTNAAPVDLDGDPLARQLCPRREVYGGTEPRRIADRFSTVDPRLPGQLLKTWGQEKLSVRLPRKFESLKGLPQQLERFIHIAFTELLE